MKVLFVILLIISGLFASFEDGKKVFEQKCTTCHKEYISLNLIKENFFEKNNSLLNLKAPSANMIVWAMMDSSNKIGDPNEPDFQQIQIENFLKDYLENPDRFNSICDENVLDYYDNKDSMKGELSEDDYTNLSYYFLEYKDNFKEEINLKEPFLSLEDEKKYLKLSKEENKKIIVYATSKTCFFCKKMDREVFPQNVIKELISKNYISIEIDMDNASLPFNLQKEYKKITPSFFFVDENATFLKQYVGSWTLEDFTNILQENKK
ncbi:thioredoxin family protein [Aliarcobacter lanthieri]|uniref:thioredoxin family protein n=1 Tax=Aliarcobacter lanthieri TaxID=1355374 RepID=UPI000478F4B3|nr:thioredoxin family protein [Aliarcobacter lanthieri]QKF58710.1 thioredoxin family protein (Thioredoxin_2 domain) [Aliarcobacter lanthieri]